MIGLLAPSTEPARSSGAASGCTSTNLTSCARGECPGASDLVSANSGFKHDGDRASFETAEIVRDPDYSNGAPTIDDTGIRVINVASAYEHSGYSPDEIAEFYPALSLADIHTALAYYYDHLDEFEDAVPATEDDTEATS